MDTSSKLPYLQRRGGNISRDMPTFDICRSSPLLCIYSDLFGLVEKHFKLSYLSWLPYNLKLQCNACNGTFYMNLAAFVLFQLSSHPHASLMWHMCGSCVK